MLVQVCHGSFAILFFSVSLKFKWDFVFLTCQIQVVRIVSTYIYNFDQRVLNILRVIFERAFNTQISNKIDTNILQIYDITPT